MEYVLSTVLFCVGLYAVIVKRNLIKIVIGVAVMGYSVNLFLILAGFRMYCGMPIVAGGITNAPTVDPLAQAMVLAAVTMGLCVTLLLTAFSIKLFERYKTLDTDEIRKLKG